MAIDEALLGFNDLGRSVTPSSLFRNSFYLQLLSPQCPKMNKKSMWELSLKKFQDFCPRDMESCHLAAARHMKLWSVLENFRANVLNGPRNHNRGTCFIFKKVFYWRIFVRSLQFAAKRVFFLGGRHVYLITDGSIVTSSITRYVITCITTRKPLLVSFCKAQYSASVPIYVGWQTMVSLCREIYWQNGI